MGESEVHINLGKLEAKAKETGLTERQMEYVSKYLTLASSYKVAASMGVRIDTASESILLAARRMGFDNVIQMYTYATGMEHGKAKRKFSVNAADLQSLYEKQNGICNLSGVTLTQNNMVLDHRIPKSKGGSHTIDNVQWLCSKVNTAKGTMSQEEFIKMCCKVASHSCGYRKPKKERSNYDGNLFSGTDDAPTFGSSERS